MSEVVLVVPCYNEVKRLDGAAFSSYTPGDFNLQLLFVNDGSTDGTGELLERLCSQDRQRLHVLHLPANQGKAEAVRQGMLEALRLNPRYVGFWDADLATPLRELRHFVQCLDARSSIDMVFGARVKLLGRTIERRVHRHYFGRVFATVVSSMLELPIYDTQCGAKLFRVNADLVPVLLTPFLTRWIFDVELLARYRRRYADSERQLQGHLVEIPLEEWRDVDGSKVKLKDGLRAAIDLIRIRRAYR